MEPLAASQTRGRRWVGEAASGSGDLLDCRQRPDAAEQRVVLVALADRDADLVGQARLIEVSNEDPLLLQPEVRRLAFAVRGGGEDEVGLAREHAPAELRQLVGQPLPL